MINSYKFQKVGVISYGVYIPKYRLNSKEIAKNWDKDESIIDSLGVEQKSVADWDEDCLTMAYEASSEAIKNSGIDPKKIGALFMGSESFPYAVKPTSTTLAKYLGLDNKYFSTDLQFACKAGTSAIQIVSSMIESGIIDYGLAIGSDKAQSKPNDALEFTASSGASAILLGRNRNKWIASLKNTYSYSSDTIDFWRREKVKFPSHTGRFTGKPSYFKHVEECTKNFLKTYSIKIRDTDYVIFHSPNKKFPEKVSNILGFTEKQLKHSLLVKEIGNTYSANSLISLSNVFDHCSGKEKILVTSYGSGAGSDSLFFVTSKNIKNYKKTHISKKIKEIIYISYSDYLKKINIL
ncbi:hydroxymethylglutaryl-CoA synthase [Patescibacteria group bacterium]